MMSYENYHPQPYPNGMNYTNLPPQLKQQPYVQKPFFSALSSQTVNPPIYHNNNNPIIHRQVPRQHAQPVQMSVPPSRDSFRPTYERYAPPMNVPTYPPQPPLNTAKPYPANTIIPSCGAGNGSSLRPSYRLPFPNHAANPLPNIEPINNLCDRMSAMSTSYYPRNPPCTVYQQDVAPPLPPRSSPPKPIPTRITQNSHLSTVYTSNSPLDRTLVDLDESPWTLIEHKLEDIPMWSEVPVLHLPPKIVETICERLDRSYWRELLPRRRLAQQDEERIKVSYYKHTDLLLKYWNPVLRELIDELNIIQCKQLISDIIQELKRAPSPVHSTPSSQVQFVYGTQNDYQHPAFNIQQRREEPHWSGPQINSNYSLSSSPTSNPSSSISTSTSLSSSCPHTQPSRTPSPTFSDTQPQRVEKKADIFVSYHKNDKEIGQLIVRRLRQLNYEVASEDDIIAGGCELLERTELFDHCRKIIGLISPEYFSDDYPYLEAICGVSKSVTAKKRSFIPIKVRETNDIPGFINILRAIMWSDEKKWDRLERSLNN